MMVKRGAEEQISEYTDFEKLESQDGNSGTWEKASSEELAKRRIVKIKRPSGNVTAGKPESGAEVLSSSSGPRDEEAAVNPFSAVKLVAPSSKAPPSLATGSKEEGRGKESGKTSLPNVSAEIANNSFTKSPEKSGTSLSSGGLSISIPSPSMASGQQSNKSFGVPSPALHSARSASTLTPGSRTPGGGKKANPFSGQSPKANPNPFLSVQDEGNINNDMWRKLSGSKGSPPKKTQDDSASDAAGIAAVPKPAAPATGGSSLTQLANPFIASSSASDGAGKNVFARGFSGFAPAVGGGEAEEGVFSKKSGAFGSSSASVGAGASGDGDGIRAGVAAAGAGTAFGLSGGLDGTATEAAGTGGLGSSWLFKKSSGNSFLSSIKENKVEALFGAKGSSSSSSSSSSSGGGGGESVVEEGASAGAAAAVPEDDGAAEAQSEEHTLHTAYGKTYAMAGGPVITGEEDETCLLQVRAKLFKLTTSAPSKADNSDQEEEDEGGAKGSSREGAAEEKDKKEEDRPKEQLEWSEVGVGPLRVLKAKDGPDARLVMRREDKKGGNGTKVILNVKIRGYTSVRKQNEKALCVSTFVPVTDDTHTGAGTTAGAEQGPSPLHVKYMLRCKLATEISQLASAIEDEAANAKATA